MAWVIHWWAQKGSSGLKTACAAKGARLRGGARRHECVHATLGLDPSAKGVREHARANTSLNKACAGLSCAAVSSPWRSCSACGGGSLASGVPASGVGLGWNSRTCKAQTGETELGKSPGAQAELRRGLLVAVGRCSGEGTAAGCSAPSRGKAGRLRLGFGGCG
jgi:hypothetical protein